MGLKKDQLVSKILETENKVPTKAASVKSLTDYADLAQKQSWKQKLDPSTRELKNKAFKITGTVWSDAIEKSLDENNHVHIPKMDEPVYIDRPIVVTTGTQIIVHPETEIKIIIDEVEHCLIQNKNIVSGQDGPIELCQGADKDILIEGGIWSDQKNDGAGPQGFRKGKEALMLGSQGAIVLSNVENATVRNLTVKDNSSFGVQIGNARNFLIENITLDNTKDGVHVEGPSEIGIIRNLSGPFASDDAVALNAWDWRTSSLTFGSITDILVEDIAVDEGACAIRILPGIKIFPNGSTLPCLVSRCIFKAIRNCHTFKIYDQPNIRCIKDDYSDNLGLVSHMFFEDIEIRGLKNEDSRDSSKIAAIEICEHASDLYFENIHMDYIPGGIYPKYLISIGPKSHISPIPFATSGTQEIFNPQASPLVSGILIKNIFTRDPNSPQSYIRHDNPEQLIHCSSYKTGGTGTVKGIQVT